MTRMDTKRILAKLRVYTHEENEMLEDQLNSEDGIGHKH